MKKQKGFTLVELLVVIAILAILATVSIVGYTSFTKKANISNDTALAAQLNLILEGDAVENGKPNDFIDVLSVLNNNGYIVQNLNPTTEGNFFAWNPEDNKIIFYDADNSKVLYPDNYDDSNKRNWYVSVGNQEEAEKVADSGAGIYLENEIETITINKLVSIDCGAYSCAKLSIKDESSDYSVSIKGKYNEVNIYAPNATINQYGSATKINVYAINTASLHIYGYVETIDIASGHLEIENKGYVNTITTTLESISAKKADNSSISFEKANNGVTLTNEGQVNMTPTEVAGLISSATKEQYIAQSGQFAAESGYTQPSVNYTINNLAELEAFRDQVNGGRNFKGVTVELTSDIKIIEAWIPISNYSRNDKDDNAGLMFAGTFDGKGHTISNLYNTNNIYTVVNSGKNSSTISGKNEVTYGLFGSINGATIKNLVIKDINISSSFNSDGTLVGDCVGGLVGYAYNECTISDVDVYGTIKASDNLGGIVGRFAGDGASKITDCENHADLEALKAYGICQENLNKKDGNKLTIENCSNYGNVSATTRSSSEVLYNTYSSGIVGIFGNGVPTYVINCSCSSSAIIKEAGQVHSYKIWTWFGQTESGTHGGSQSTFSYPNK